MDYIKVAFPKPADDVKEEILIALLADAGFESFESEGDKVSAYIPAKDFKKDLLPPGFGNPEIELIKDRNWNEVWESNYNPVLIAGKVFIRAPFHEKNDDAEFDIVINPKMAFGTAHHETTALMIEYLLDKGNDIKGKTVLDMGAGTGVLAILSSMLGAEKVDAVDNDSRAVDSSIENAAVNKCSNIDVKQGDASILPGKKIYDLILANINKNILLSDMETYAKSLKKGGEIIFSGFYENDLEDIKKKAATLGLEFVDNKTKNSWVAAKFKSY